MGLPVPQLASDVHVDVALERGTVGNEDARGFDVAHDAALCLQLDFIRCRDVAGDLTRDVDVLRLDVGFYDTRRLDVERLFESDLALHSALDDEIFVAGDLAVDDDGAADERVSHG